jgi:hypothetical protein
MPRPRHRVNYLVGAPEIAKIAVEIVNVSVYVRVLRLPCAKSFVMAASFKIRVTSVKDDLDEM